MKKIIHFEYTQRRGGPLGNQNISKRTGMAHCGVKLDEFNTKGITDVNCPNCLKKISLFDK